MLTIRADLAEAMIAHACAEHPIEACGVIAGPRATGQPERHIPMRNAEESETLYRFDTDQQLSVWQDMENRSEVPVITYHSHTATEAYPGTTDVRYAANVPHHVIISTRFRSHPELRSFQIRDGVVTEEPVVIVDHYISDIETIRWRWNDNGVLVREGWPSGLKAHSHITTLLAEIDRLTQLHDNLTVETINMPVFLLNDPPEWHDDLVNPIPKQHMEFIEHTRHTTPWHSELCPDCQEEPGVHDRRGREMRAAMHSPINPFKRGFDNPRDLSR